MAGYDRHYDYGMRGYPQTTRPMMRGQFGRPNPDYGYDFRREERSNPQERMARRVTARYNMDYVVGNRGDRYPRNFNFYTGDRMDRMGDGRYYARPYYTTGGTRTMRGASYPTGYDYPDYGPDYGGRFPDEL